MITLDFALKLVVLLLLTPFWWPFLKAIYEEVEGALRHEGGLFGRSPTEREVQRIESEKGVYDSGLLNQPFQRPQATRRTGRTRTSGNPRGRAGAPVQRTRRTGF